MELAKENTTSYIILGLLTHEDMTGYDIKRNIEESIKDFWNIGFGQIYPTLKNLESDGLINRVDTSDSSGKKLYAITEKGREYFLDWLKDSTVTEYVKYEIILKLFFGNQIQDEDNIKKIDDFYINSHQKYETANKYSKMLSNIIKDDDDHLYYYLTTLFGKYMYAAYMDWASEARTLLEGKKNRNKDKTT